jgi:hypothetical protein
MGMLPPLKPLPIKDRVSMVFVQYGQIDVVDGAFVLIDTTGVRTHIPVGSVACIMLEPGTRVSHAAVRLLRWWAPCWCGWESPACACTPAGNPAALVPTVCSTKPSWRWTMSCV